MASSSSTAERDLQLLSIGKRCSEPLCGLVDFLPFKCHHCGESFCQEHYKVEGHKCPKYDESQHNRVAPNCPLCNIPVAVRPGQDPNHRMEQHFEKECSVVTGRVQAKSTPVCARGNCKKVLFSPIRCDKCRQQFCPSHRFPSDHACKSPPTRQTTTPIRPNLPTFASATAGAKNLNAKASEAVGAAKKSIAAAAASANATASSASSSSSRPSLPFNKTDRPLSALLVEPLDSDASCAPMTSNNANSTTTPPHTLPHNDDNQHKSRPSPVIDPMSFIPRRARAERESRVKAMQARDKKGLLSEEERRVLTQYEEEAKKDKDCVIM